MYIAIKLLRGKMAQKHKLHNWSHYNRSLKQRGNIFFYFNEKNVSSITHGNMKYSNEAIIICHQIKYHFRLPYRQTEGFMRALNSKLSESDKLSVPDYTTMCKRLKSLEIPVKDFRRNKSKDICVLIDSTGLEIYDLSDWHKKMNLSERKYKGVERYRKLHVMLDSESRQVIDAELTKGFGVNTGDLSVGSILLQRNSNNIEQCIADGAYNSHSLYKLCHERNTRFLSPPSRTHNKSVVIDAAYNDRNNAIDYIRGYSSWDEGLNAWKKLKSYHVRSRVESYMASFKRTFGRNLKSMDEVRRKNETIIKINMLNKMKTLIQPISSKI